jgi:hypothetical protein
MQKPRGDADAQYVGFRCARSDYKRLHKIMRREGVTNLSDWLRNLVGAELERLEQTKTETRALVLTD